MTENPRPLWPTYRMTFGEGHPCRSPRIRSWPTRRHRGLRVHRPPARGLGSEPADAGNVKRDVLKRVNDALAPLRGSYADLELFVQGGYANWTAVSAQTARHHCALPRRLRRRFSRRRQRRQSIPTVPRRCPRHAAVPPRQGHSGASHRMSVQPRWPSDRCRPACPIGLPAATTSGSRPDHYYEQPIVSWPQTMTS